MAQTREGATKVAAAKAGLSVSDYLKKIDMGLKRCTRCKKWHPVECFGNDRTRYDGKDSSCGKCRRVEIPKTNKGKKFPNRKKVSPEGRARMSAAKKGVPNIKLRGRKHSIESRAKISKSVRESPRLAKGPACHSYKDGKCAERRGERFTKEYKQWRYDVYLRDKFSCQLCGDNRGGNLNAHHIFSFADHPELRLNLDNGITVCETCHEGIHHRPLSIRNRRKSGFIKTIKMRCA
jgi:5-methylcytosine-specific restriction endonuclease McrA